MAKQLKEIEIPFGAKDSELYGCEYTIPDGMEATIVDNKIVVKKKESEDERIRKNCIHFLELQKQHYAATFEIEECIAWLEKQGEQNLANSAKTCKDEQKPNPCDGCINRKGCINCENGELREVEQKPADKIEPKFHEGEWIIHQGTENI